jgi:hypothetical protein
VALKDVLRLTLVIMPNVVVTRALEAAGEASGEALNVVLETDNPRRCAGWWSAGWASRSCPHHGP